MVRYTRLSYEKDALASGSNGSKQKLDRALREAAFGLEADFPTIYRTGLTPSYAEVVTPELLIP